MTRYLFAIVCAALILIASGCSPTTPPEPSSTAPLPSPKEQAPSDTPAQEVKLTEQESADVLERFHRAIALVENGKSIASRDLLAPLAEQFPKDREIAMNLALASLIAVDEATGAHGDVAAAIAEAEKRLKAFQELDKESALPAILEARLANRQNQLDRQFTALEAATQRDPKDASVWLELFEAGQLTPDQDKGTLAYQAAQKAHELAPDNLWVLYRLLFSSIRRKEPALTGYLEKALAEMRPINDLISRRMGFDQTQQRDPVSVFEEALAAAQKQEWTSPAISSVRGVIGMLNALKADDAFQSDKLAIERHELEFLAATPSDAVLQRLTLKPVAASADSPIKLVAIDGAAGVLETPGATDMTVLDFTMDGHPDIAVLAPAKLAICEKSNDGWKETAELAVPEGFTRFVAFDLDNDSGGVSAAGEQEQKGERQHTADLDFVLYGPAGVLAVKNHWDDTAKTRTLETMEAFPELSFTNVTSAVVLDVDMDGDLDLLTSAEDAVHLLVNVGNSTFQSGDSLLMEVPADATFQSGVAVDYDRDNDLDVLVATTAGRMGLFENLRHGVLRFKPLEQTSSVKAVEIAELDGNVSWDLIGGGSDGLQILMTRTVGRSDTQVMNTVTKSDAGASDGLLVLDIDNDADDDILSWSSKGIVLWRNTGDGTLSLAELTGNDLVQTPASTVAMTDLDADGQVDLAVLSGDTVRLLRNETGSGSYLNVGLVESRQTEGGVSKKRVNHYGYGSLLELRSGDHYQARMVRTPWTHFGLDAIAAPEVLRVTWPNGVPQNVIGPRPNSTIMELQSLLTSCPYLYSWNGEKFVFVTDLLWAAPMGLPDPSGGFVPCREWEYLKIPAKSLQPRNGHYEISITEELYETAYFDQVELIAVDHPADVEIFTNEKVGPAEMAQPMIHTANNLRSPTAATDLKGKDILDKVRDVDDAFARTWPALLMQGYASETHGVEFNLGDIGAPKQVKLFLTGWLMPTDAGLTTKIRQRPDLDGPVPPSIEVPDGNGGWKVAMPYMGFPGGKTKEMVVDVTGLVNPSDPRLRIVSGQELYWDQIAFTVDESPETVLEQPLKLVEADLHFRGVSAATAPIVNAPECYEYDWLQETPRFPPMSGRFTKFGDVAELLREPDDRVAIIGTGDEIILRFAMPEKELPEGWVRDFVIHNVGWEKDAQLNTVLGQTVEPLPYLKMTSYPYAEDPPQSEERDEYLKTWQTRESDDTSFRRLIKTGPETTRLYW